MDVSQDRTHLTLCATPEPPADSQPAGLRARIRRICGILFGVGTHVLFAFTVWHLFFFLRDGESSLTSGENQWSPLSADLLLALQFSVIHSLLLYPSVQRALTRWIPKPFYGCFFCTSTCLTLLIAIAWWKPADSVLYDLRGTVGGFAVQAGFYGSWIALFYSLHLSGLGYQTGWTPWWYWFRKQPQPKREFRELGAYRLFRHPIYLSFLGLIWFTPRMTADHAVLTGLWTIYILVGSYLKDERLAFYLRDQYRDYQQRVPGYPFLHRGPLGRRTMSERSLKQDNLLSERKPHRPRKAA